MANNLYQLGSYMPQVLISLLNLHNIYITLLTKKTFCVEGTAYLLKRVFYHWSNLYETLHRYAYVKLNFRNILFMTIFQFLVVGTIHLQV